jgi:gluconokinase
MTILVIDIGSSSVRALLMDEFARPIEGASVAHKYNLLTDSDGASTADANTLRYRIETCIDMVLQHPAAAQIRAVGMACFVGNLLGFDRDGRVLTPVYTYADTRSALDAEALALHLDPISLHQRTGCRLHSSYHPAKLRWLARTQPALYASVHQWADMVTFLYRAWFGRVDVACSTSVASWSGLLNRESAAWDGDILAVLGLSGARLPALADASVAQYGLSPEYAARWTVLADLPFYLALGDGAAANIGSGAVGGGQLALTMGTTAAIRAVIPAPAPIIPPGLWGYRIDARHHLVGGATSEGGNVFEWARNTLNLPAPETIEAALASAIPDQHGLTVLPLLAGERSPGWAANATATMHGMRLSTTPLNILQALLESVAHRLALIADQLGGDGAIYAGGGALYASPAWAQMLCHAFGCPLLLLDEPEVTARGVALFVMKYLDSRDWASMPPRIRAQLIPHPEASEQLRAARIRQAALYHSIYGGGYRF